MKFLVLYIALFIYAAPVISQIPEFSWGEKISRKFGQIENMEIIGVDRDGFFATYSVNDQITLEHYNPRNERFWTVALHPKTPDGHKAKYHCVISFRDNLYMISSHTLSGKTNVYAQQINHNGNYSPDIILLLEDAPGDEVKLATSSNEEALAISISGPEKHTLVLLSQVLHPQWDNNVKGSGKIEELLVLPDGTAYILLRASAAAPSTEAYFLYQFNRNSGKSSRLTLGHTDYRPIRAKLAASTNGSILIAGYIAPSNTVASQSPEPIGTFLYRINKHDIKQSFVAYTPFNGNFIDSYKRLKPDYDNSQRLRHLTLDHLLPLPDGSMYLIGEVCYTENGAGIYTYHNNDIIIARLAKNGKAVFTTSINKLQSGTNKHNTIRSYFAAIVNGTLQVMYLDFEYNYEANERIAMFSPGVAAKTPVIVSVSADGTLRRTALHNTDSGNNHGFYLRPCSAFRVSGNEYIVVGIGPEFYRYGRMKF